MKQVQPWAATRLHTLQPWSGQAIREQEWSDDRLSIVLDALSDDQQWHRVEGLLTVTIAEQVEERRVRAYGKRPAGVRVERALSVRAEVDAPAVEEAIRWLGWRVYATNQPKEELPLELVIVETTCPTEYTYWEVWYG